MLASSPPPSAPWTHHYLHLSQTLTQELMLQSKDYDGKYTLAAMVVVERSRSWQAMTQVPTAGLCQRVQCNVHARAEQ